MPRIILKPNSPEYVDPDEVQDLRGCDMPGCDEHGDHKAPKNRGLDEYYHFCLEHVREHNKAWNFFSGMAESEVQEHMHRSMYGDRPTWRYGSDGEDPEEILREKIRNMYGNGGGYSEQQHHKTAKEKYFPGAYRNTPEFEALVLMGLSPPVDLEAVKERYKALVKKHHPDLNQGCSESEEMIKRVNMAYTLLKVAYENFDKLDG